MHDKIVLVIHLNAESSYASTHPLVEKEVYYALTVR